MNKKAAHVLENLDSFVEACDHKNPLARLLWLYENDLGTSMEIAKKHPELAKKMKKIGKIYSEELEPVLLKLHPLIKSVEKVSPKS